MITLYFSGTGNSRMIAQAFAKKMNHTAYCIEEPQDFDALMVQEDILAFCYPVYTSDVPAIMKVFVTRYKQHLKGKKIIILCTQYLFSGDGARVFSDLIDQIDSTILYAEHFRMPNNICNLWVLPLSSERSVKKMIKRADKKLDQIVANLKRDISIKRGFNPLSKFLGWATQRAYFPAVEERAKKDVRIHSDCIVCGLCVRICPMKNLEIVHDKVCQLGACTLCYRCVNQCPQKAITVLIHMPVKKQFRQWL